MKRAAAALLALIVWVLLLPGTALGAEPYTLQFNNKISETGNDPWIIWHEGYYYYCWSGWGGVCVARVRNLPDLGCGVENLPENDVVRAKLVWTPEDDRYSDDIWAPELHFLEGHWYIYVAADDGNNDHHRMLCLEAKTEDPLDGFVMKSVVRVKNDRWAIDGTVLQWQNKLYFVWSGWEGNENVAQNLYIAQMQNPWSLTGKRVRISRPELDWECVGDPLINEGPTALVLGDHVHIVYSASGSWTDDYCLGMLTLTGKDPMDPAAWTKSPQPVFGKTNRIFGPGHASFVSSPDGKRHYIAYHANEESGSGWAGRKFWIQEYTVNDRGWPVFGRPEPAGTMQTVPVNWQ